MTIRWILILALTGNTAFGMTPPQWNFEKAYQNASNVFLAKVIEVETGVEYDTGFTGPYGDNKVQARVVWTDGEKSKLSVLESFKGKAPLTVELLNLGNSQSVASPEESPPRNDGGQAREDFAFPQAVLSKGEVYLVFISLSQEGWVTRIGWRNVFQANKMQDELKLLRLIKNNPEIQTIADARQSMANQLTQEKDKLEQKLFKILNESPELEIRKIRLLGFIHQLGFKGLWTRDQASDPDDSEIEKFKNDLWDKVSQEIIKIDMILKAREKQSSE